MNLFRWCCVPEERLASAAVSVGFDRELAVSVRTIHSEHINYSFAGCRVWYRDLIGTGLTWDGEGQFMVHVHLLFFTIAVGVGRRS